MKIMTWNTALTEGSDATAVINYVKEFLDKEDDAIAVLQQIPYKIPDESLDGDEKWRNAIKHPSYKQFDKTFPEAKYTVSKNTTFNNGRIVMLTAIVTRMQCEKDAKFITTNREAAVQIKGSYSVFGVHAKYGDDNKSYLIGLNSKEADIILGDFNAGDYYLDENVPFENRDTFKSILKDYVCICNMPTKEVKNKKGELIRKTCIDHVFVKSSIVDKCSSLKIHEDIKISDHYPITFYID